MVVPSFSLNDPGAAATSVIVSHPCVEARPAYLMLRRAAIATLRGDAALVGELKRLRRWAGVCLAGAVFVAAPWAIIPAWGDACTIVSIGSDTSQADNYVGVLCGEAPGETFLALDTLISSVAVWRPAVETPYGGGFKLWITDVDSAQVPRTDRVVLEGPVITVPFGDGIHPIQMQYSFDPPFPLPHQGYYFFAVQDYCGGHFDFLTCTSDVYPDGMAWRTGRSCFSGCYLRPSPDRLISNDLVFTIEFCKTVVATHRLGWGRLKVIYR